MIVAALAVSTTLAAEPDWKQLRAPEATASSFLRSNWNAFTENYHASYLLDGDPKTAWVEGATGSGAGEWVGWSVSPVREVSRVKLRLRNGYQKSDSLLTANAAPATLTVTLSNNGREVLTDTWSVKRATGWQTWEKAVEGIAFDTVRLTVGEVVEGRSYKDLCISDAELFVVADTPYNAPVEAAKHQALTGWIAERRAAAEYFAKRPKTYPFASTHFEIDFQELTPEETTQFLRDAEKRAARLAAVKGSGGPTYRVAVKDRVRLPDGLGIDAPLLDFFGEGVTYFEAEGEWRPKRTDTNPIGSWVSEMKLGMVTRSVVDGVTDLTFKERTVVEERGTSITESEWLVVLDGERPVSAFATGRTVGDIECPSGWDNRDTWFFDWQDGKLGRAVHTTHLTCAEGIEGPSTWSQRYVYTPASS